MSKGSAGEDILDVAVIGGGLAGGVAGYHLAKHELKVAIFEKEPSAHDKVCGEFLSAESIPLLQEIGVDPKTLGATEIAALRLHGPQSSLLAKLPRAGRGLSRKVLDEEVLKQAALVGVDVHMGEMVKELSGGIHEDAAGLFHLVTARREVKARRVILATGKSEFRSVQSREKRASDCSHVGFKAHLRLKPSMLAKLADEIHLFVFTGGYGGLSRIENGLACFCFLMEREKLKNIGTDWDALSSYIGRECYAASAFLDGAEPVQTRLLSVSKIPYGFLRREPPAPGLFCVGDQMAVIPSLTGDGMSIAMMTGKEAARLAIDSIHPGCLSDATKSSAVYQRQARRALRPQIEIGLMAHRLFRHPELCDWTIRLISKSPAVVGWAFEATRCRVERGSNRQKDLLQSATPVSS